MEKQKKNEKRKKKAMTARPNLKYHQRKRRDDGTRHGVTIKRERQRSENK